MTIKILLIGRAKTGKTSIKKAILEGKDPIELMIKPLEPTRGIETTLYNWMDLNLSIFDTSGQELPILLENKEDQKKAFEETNTVLYLFDFPIWSKNPEEIIEEIHYINNLLKEEYKEAQLILVMHKIDIINVKLKSRLYTIKEEILSLLNIQNGITIYFTSISPDLIAHTYDVFFDILSKFSEETKNLKMILDNNTKKFSRTMCLITDQENHLITQSKSINFEVSYISKLHELLEPLDNKAGEITIIHDNIFYLDEGSNIFSIIVTEIKSSKHKLRNLICITEIKNSDRLNSIKNNILNEINQYYS